MAVSMAIHSFHFDASAQLKVGEHLHIGMMRKGKKKKKDIHGQSHWPLVRPNAINYVPKTMNADNADSAQRRRRRRAPFESSRATRVSTIPGRNSSNDGNARQQRLFSARAFTASQTRSPFAMTDPEHPSTSQQTTINPPMNAQRSSKNRKAHLVTADLEDEEDSVLEADQSTGDLLSDIDDIELGELYGDPLAEAHRTERRIEHNQPEKSLTLTGQQSELQIENASLDAQQQHPIVKPKLPQRFHQRKRIVPPQRQPFSRATGLLQMEEGRLATEQLRPEGPSPERAFSPALDVQLATEPPERKESRSSTKSIVTILSPRNLMAAARKSPTPPHAEMPSTQQVEEIRKKSSSVQNGSIGGVPPATFVTVPTPPQIRISSPQEQLRPMSKGTQSELAAASSDGHRQQPMNPSLIKGISKSISRFRNRNRILDADAQEQANFMSKFGMSGVQPGSVILPGVNVDTGKDGKRKGNWLSRLVFDTNENYFYHWIALVSTAYVYNLLVVIARTVFIDMAAGRLWMLWLPLDLLMDSIYLTDMFVRSRTGYLEQGLLVRDCAKIRALYLRNRQFLWDCASILPLDHIYWFIFWKPQAILRINRLFRKDRIQRFMEQTETRTSMPNAFRVGVVVWYIAVIIHWNACFYFFISETIGLGTDGWVYGVQNKQSLPDGVNDTLTRRYIYSFYWSTLILTTIGEVPGPQQNVEYAFVTVDLMCGVLIFATIVGNVGSMISNISAGRTDFQNRIDSIKQYMDLRGVGKQLEVRVIKWFDYLWANKQGLSDAQVLRVLPDKLQAEIAMHVHFETLRKVRIFQDCEAGLLAELVLKLQLQVFSPGDYVCRKGDIGREMYIVKRGMLQVVADDGLKVFATLSEGAVFGELSILNIAGSKNGNRRTANVRSVGYTDLFVLNKNDLWIALREYPEARKILINKGRELLRKDNLLDENAPEEQKTAEEIAEELQSAVRILQIRIARLLAEHTNTETKLQGRITYLEAKLHKYRDLMIGS